MANSTKPWLAAYRFQAGQSGNPSGRQRPSLRWEAIDIAMTRLHLNPAPIRRVKDMPHALVPFGEPAPSMHENCNRMVAELVDGAQRPGA